MENFYQKSEMEGRGSSETTENFYEKTSKTMENFKHKPEMEGRGSSETTANFYEKPPKLWKISTSNLKWREEVPPKLR